MTRVIEIVVAAVIVLMVGSIFSVLPKPKPIPFTAEELEAIEEDRLAIAAERAQRTRDKEARAKRRNLLMGYAIAASIMVAGSLATLYVFVRFVKWAWTD